MFNKKVEMRIYLGVASKSNNGALDNPTYMESVYGFPTPAPGSYIYGRSSDTGRQYIGKVEWTEQRYEDNTIRVFASE